jgi:hypothetical protein
MKESVMFLILSFFQVLSLLLRLDVDPSPEDDKPDADGEKEEKKPVPYSRFSAVTQENLALKAKVAEQDRKDREAEEAKQREAGNFQALITARDEELKSLKPKAERVDRLETLLGTQIDTETKGWPAEVLDLDPGADDLEGRYKWFTKSKKLVEKLAGTSRVGNPGNPKPANGGDTKKGEEKVTSELQGTGRYRPL